MLDFFMAAMALKKVSRQGWIEKLGADVESVAEHSYAAALVGMYFSDLKGYDTEKVIKMTLIHDLAESIAGDCTPEQPGWYAKTHDEANAIEKILEKLPEPALVEYTDLWLEYHRADTRESRLVRQIDKLEMALQARACENDGHPREKLHAFYESAGNDIEDDDLLDALRRIIDA